MTEKHVVQTQPKQLLRGQKRHSRLLGRPVALALVTPLAGGDEILRSRRSALCFGHDVIERQILGVFVVAAILATITIPNIDPGPLHRAVAPTAADIDVMAQAHDRRNAKLNRRGPKNVVAVKFLDIQLVAHLHADRPRDADRAKRLV